MSAARHLLAVLVGLTPLALAASCSKERRESTNPGWFVPCAGDADCTVGACLCGRCGVQCGGSGACSDGPPGSACFARGSIAHEASCAEHLAPDAICLPTCASDGDCPEGLTCAVGACLPAPRPPAADAGSDACASESCPAVQTAADRQAFNESALLPPGFHWAPEVIEGNALYTDDGFAYMADYVVVCPPDDPCPTLEQVLSDDACLDIIQSCDLIRVAHPYRSYMYWYTGYGEPPVAAIRKASGAVFGRFATTRELGCAPTEITMCSTCGRKRPLCEDVPGGLPPPPAPLPVSGCECESDGAGGAHVSLDCFCSLYNCPSYDTLRADCPFDDPGPGQTLTAIDACGQIQFDLDEYSGRRFTYDPTTGELVAALAFNQGPVTAPCNGYRVSAGATPECAEPSPPCGCNGRTPGITEVALPGCEATDWFQNL